MSRSFNGSSQYLSTTTAPVTGYPFTIAGWFKTTNGGTMACLSDTGAPGYDHFRADTDNANNTYLASYPSGGSAFPSNLWTSNTWSHFAAICTSSTSRRIVVNGNWASSGTSTGDVTPSSLDKFYVGVADNDANETLAGYFAGLVAHVAVWSSALSQTDVESLAGPFSSGAQSGSGANPLAVQAASLVAYWPLAGSTSPEPDSKGSNSLTLTGSPGAGASDPTVDAPPSTTSIPVIMHHLLMQGIR